MDPSSLGEVSQGEDGSGVVCPPSPIIEDKDGDEARWSSAICLRVGG